MIGHHLDKRARVEVALHVIGRNLDEAETGEAAGDIGFRAVDRDPSEQPELVAWARKLGAPEMLARCFATIVAK